jgi:uncharacterized repeat protein (TIGR03803 family)
MQRAQRVTSWGDGRIISRGETACNGFGNELVHKTMFSDSALRFILEKNEVICASCTALKENYMQVRSRGRGWRFGFSLIHVTILFCLVLFGPAFAIRAGTAQEVYPFTSGAQPSALIEGSSGVFYGTTRYGGDKGLGRVFRVTVGEGINTIASFAGTNGMFPETGVILGPDGALYGTTSVGGSNSLGTVFRVTTNGDLTSLVSFSGETGATLGNRPRFSRSAMTAPFMGQLILAV